ncbi:MAG TPA: cytochrome c oxidase subunit 3, partial [Candidatus Saccharimonadaceae bacterium]|nr:cytochrome c oxidase subunit 3 [Candidatus Saccharimonadaceae bacterium]
GVNSHQIFNLPYILVETIALLISSVTSGIAYLAASVHKKHLFIGMMLLTIALGLVFIILEFNDFAGLVAAGHSWRESGFLSGYFTLVGTHGLHISIGLLWAITMVIVSLKRGLTTDMIRKVGLFSLFWHFLDLIWIFIFSIVYLMGVM